MCQFFEKRGYPASIVQAGHHRAQLTDRQSSLQTSQKEHSDRIPFTLTFHPHNHSVKVLLRRKYTFSNLSRYQNYITQIVVVPNLKSKFQRSPINIPVTSRSNRPPLLELEKSEFERRIGSGTELTS